VIYLGIFPGAIAYVSWAYALARTPASMAGSFLYPVPVVGMIIAWFWLGEIPSILSLLGGILVISGIMIVNRWGKAKA
jgi:drug/metabolite transporter (DMT)-like permease